jgi:hypothetical protein
MTRRTAVWLLASGLWLQTASPQSAITTEVIYRTVNALCGVIQQEYFDEEKIPAFFAELKNARANGHFETARTPEELARLLTQVMFSVSRDKHLSVQVVRPPTTPPPGGGPAPADRNKPTTAGFKRVEILPGNIGLLELTMFLRPVEHQDALAEAMKKLAPADALIIDMRANGGGSPGTIALLMSYLFDQPELPLFDIIPRDGARDTYKTEPASVALPRNGSRPIWVLTSSRSFSGGEGFAYLMQEQKRASIVGEQTAGAANPGRPYPVNELFEVTVPNGHISSAITHGNWEGDGVTPDIVVPAATALDVAIERAKEELKKRGKPVG